MRSVSPFLCRLKSLGPWRDRKGRERNGEKKGGEEGGEEGEGEEGEEGGDEGESERRGRGEEGRRMRISRGKGVEKSNTEGVKSVDEGRGGGRRKYQHAIQSKFHSCTCTTHLPYLFKLIEWCLVL